MNIRHIELGSTLAYKDFAHVPKPFEIFVQHAIDDQVNHEPRGLIDYEGFLIEFRQFDWVNETNQAFWAKRSSPGIAVRNMQTNAMLSVVSHDVLSAALNNKEPTSEGWLDFIIVLKNEQRADTRTTVEEPARDWYAAFSTPHRSEVEKAYLLFFFSSYELLHEHLSTLMQVTVKD